MEDANYSFEIDPNQLEEFYYMIYMNRLEKKREELNKVGLQAILKALEENLEGLKKEELIEIAGKAIWNRLEELENEAQSN